MSELATLALALLAQSQAPLPAEAPRELVHVSRLHLRAGEGLEADQLRGLARRDVVLWLRTTSNTLADATLETVDRFSQAWVRWRWPVKDFDAAALRRQAPRAGLWVEGAPAGLRDRSSLGARPLAVELTGPLTDEAEALYRAVRPQVVRWTPAGPLDVLAWARFRGLPGRKVLVEERPLAAACVEEAGQVALEVHVATLLAMSTQLFPCGPGLRVVVEPEVDLWLLQSLVVRTPSVELVVDVGEEPRRVAGARRLMEALGLAPLR